VLTVRHESRAESVALLEEVEDEPWFVGRALNDQELPLGPDADADELIASEAQEIMEVLGLRWPVCSVHRQVMSVCSGEWLCPGTPAHAAMVGALGAPQVPPSQHERP
jgi:hypothetical protein